MKVPATARLAALAVMVCAVSGPASSQPRQAPADLQAAIGGQAIRTHASAYASASRGDAAAFRTLVGNALDRRLDWWDSGLNREALDAERALAGSLRPPVAGLQRELDCAADAGAARDADAVLGVLRRCRLWIDGGELPASSEVAKFLLARIDATKAAPTRELLDRFGTVLDARARGAAGAKFAVSRVVGALADKDEWPARGETLLREALGDFAQEARLHRMRNDLFPPTPAERQGRFVAWALAEYAGLSSIVYPGIGPGAPTSTTLASVMYTLRERRVP